jgi:hypothetical protein
MKVSTFYRIASVLLVLFAIGHTAGFSQSDPAWKVDALLASMRSTRFDLQGFHRTYWDFFVGAGLTVGIFYLFSAVLAWQFARVRPATGTAWAFAAAFAAITVVSCIYLFVIPIAFSFLITLCLSVAAWKR